MYSHLREWTMDSPVTQSHDPESPVKRRTSFISQLYQKSYSRYRSASAISRLRLSPTVFAILDHFFVIKVCFPQYLRTKRDVNDSYWILFFKLWKTGQFQTSVCLQPFERKYVTVSVECTVGPHHIIALWTWNELCQCSMRHVTFSLPALSLWVYASALSLSSMRRLRLFV